MPRINNAIDGMQGRRAAPRETILLAASVLAVERSRSATVVDVTTKSAKLRGCGDVAVGDDLWIKVGVIDSLARVDWCKDDLCGVTFDQALGDDDLRHLRCEARHTLVMRVTPEERLAAMNWIAEFTG
jgi:hypothetical protein